MTVESDRPRSSVLWQRAALTFVFLWFFIGGIAHFTHTALEMRIVPPWLPHARELVWASGVFELLGAAGLLWRATRRWAGWGLIALTVAVTPANVTMLQQAAQFDVPRGLLVARLPLQLVLLALIAWSALGTAPGRAPAQGAAR